MQEDVGALGKTLRGAVRDDLVPHRKRVFAALCLFLRHQLAAGGEKAVLGEAVDVFRALGKSRRDAGSRLRGPDGKLARQPTQEPFEILLLLFRET